MKITFLGTGTSHGVPSLLCECKVCKDAAGPGSKNRRTRCSLYVQHKDNHILIDTSMDFREQMLKNDIRKIDSILYTHDHADHIFGLPDIRSYTENDQPLECYGSPQTMECLKRTFHYIFHPTQIGGGIPRIRLNEIEGRFRFQGSEIIPVTVKHGIISVYGYRIEGLTYIPDVSEIPESSRELLQNLKILIIDGLRYNSHPTHFSIDQALAEAKLLKPETCYLTHIAHDVDHYNISLPENVFLAYDGLQLSVH